MRSSTGLGLPEALIFDSLVGRTSEGYSEKTLYAIVGSPGVFRRVARSSTGLKATRPGAVLAVCNGGVVELVKDRAAEHELHCSGFLFASPQDQAKYIQEMGTDLPKEQPPAAQKPQETQASAPEAEAKPEVLDAGQLPAPPAEPEPDTQVEPEPEAQERPKKARRR